MFTFPFKLKAGGTYISECTVKEALFEKLGFGISMLIVIILWCISTVGIKISIKYYGVKIVGSVKPLYLLAGSSSLIAGLLYYISIKKDCAQWNAYPTFCPFPAWFNHNAILHVLFVFACWLMTFVWLPGTDYGLVQSNTEI